MKDTFEEFSLAELLGAIASGAGLDTVQALNENRLPEKSASPVLSEGGNFVYAIK